MDGDLQHPPEVIERFVERWREGYQVVYGQRVSRETDGRLRRYVREQVEAFTAGRQQPVAVAPEKRLGDPPLLVVR